MIALYVLLSLGQPEPVSDPVVRRWLDGQERFPSLADTLRAAEDALQLTSAESLRAWSKRARLRGWVPRVDIRVGTDRDLGVRRPASGAEAWTEAQAFGVDLGLRFGLSDVIFSTSELQASRVARRQASLLKRVRSEVARLYVRRLKSELVEANPWARAELDSVLDGLTAGFWRRSLR